MKTLCLFIFLSGITVAFAQSFHLQGCVIDAQTNQPIAATTISIVEKSLFYPADDAGKFDISSKELAGVDSIAFSCVGYRTKKIKVSDLRINIIIKLEPMINMLQEVKIGVGTPVLVKVGSKQKNSNQMTWTLTGGDMAAFMEGSKKVKGFIQTVGFYLSNGRRYLKGGDITAPFRIRLFGVEPDGAPGVELTKDIIIVSAKKDKAWFDIDVSAYHIRNPDSGFFVSFTLLNYEYYKVKKGADTADKSGERWATIDTAGVHHYLGARNAADVITPRLGVSSQESKQCRCYFSDTSLQDMSWHWIKDIYHSGYMIRATIAPD